MSAAFPSFGGIALRLVQEGLIKEEAMQTALA